MATLVKWLLRRRDQCSVLYSPFGLPGDAVEERAQPTTIIVAPFDDNHPDFIFMHMCHAQRAAVASAGFGMSFVLLMFISAFFEFDWYHHKKGVDLIALLTLFFYLGFGVLIHYYVIIGVRRQSASYLLPFIVVYMVIIGSESVAALYPLMHVHTPGFMLGDDSRNVFIFSLVMFLIVISVQATMLAAVCKCRVYLSRKQMHNTAMKVAERSRAKDPGIQVLLAASANGAVSPAVGTTQVSTDSNEDQPTARERSQDVEQINAQMQFAPNVQPPPYAASASSTYAYDQPPSTGEVPVVDTSSPSDTKPAV